MRSKRQFWLLCKGSDFSRNLRLHPSARREAQTATESAQVGLRLHSSDEKYVAQFRLAGFTLSRLPPYEKWENLLDEARRLWAIYVESWHRNASCGSPRATSKFESSFRTWRVISDVHKKLVDVPDEAPQVVETFFQRFRLVEIASGARVILTLA